LTVDKTGRRFSGPEAGRATAWLPTEESATTRAGAGHSVPLALLDSASRCCRALARSSSSYPTNGGKLADSEHGDDVDGHFRVHGR
jgi:hypothetical protein